MKRILFITAEYIGDAFRTTGVLKHYLDQYPNAKLTIACGKSAAALFQEYSNLENIFIYRGNFA